MENNENIEKLINYYINNSINMQTNKPVVYQEELIQKIIQDIGIPEEKIREVLQGFVITIKKLHKENPEGLREFFRERLGAEYTIYDT